MTSQKQPKSFQDRLRQIQKSGFVGREGQIALFRQTLRQPAAERIHLIFSVSGQGGVGKSTLIEQFRKISEEANLLTTYTDESERSVPEVMGRFAERLEQQGYKLAQFSDRYRVFRQKRQELEADPEAPQGFSAFLGRTVAKAGVRLARRVPVGGAVFDLVDEDAFATQTSEWASYVAKKLTNKDEVRLIQEPIAELTPLFLKDLCKAAEKSDIVLCFDTYERSEEFLDDWLREVLDGRYGEAPLNLLIVVAGRQELDRNHWANFDGAIMRLPLDAFTEEEAQNYLARKSVTNPQVVDVILRLSGRLPLLVAMLAAESPDDPNQIGDPSDTAVERFLKWVEDAKQRQVALDAALPRCLNRDVVAQLSTPEEAETLFSWLKTMPFVKESSDGWTYHEVVRTQMLRYKRLAHPQNWADLHGKLADYYDTLRNDLGLEEKQQQRDAAWQNYTLNVLYHRLCQAPQKNLSIALNEFLAALKNRRTFTFAQRWAETMVQSGLDPDAANVLRWGNQLAEGLKAYEEDRYPVAEKMFTAVLNFSEIKANWKSVALGWRGDTYRLMKRYEEALKDFDRAIVLDEKLAWAIAFRGHTYRAMKRYEEALQDFDHTIATIALDEKLAWAIAFRGQTYCLMQRYEEALQDFDHAIALDEKLAWAIAERGKTYCLMQRYEEALQDFDHAIVLDEKLAWAIAERGKTYRLMQRYEEALQDFDRAIVLDDKYAWAIAERGKTYRAMKRYEEALQDFDHAITLDEKLAWAIAGRGETYRLMERYEEALQDFDRVIVLDDKWDWAIAFRGHTYRAMKRYEEALRDFDRAIALDDKWAWAIASRGETYRLMERYEEALKDFDRAIALDDKWAWAIASRGETYRLMERYEEALQDFDRVIVLDDKWDWAIAFRGHTYRAMKRYEEALRDFDRAIALDDKWAWAIASRGETYRLMERYEEALQDFDRAIALDDKWAWAIAGRGETYRLMERYEEALQDFDHVIVLDDKWAWAIANRGEAYMMLGCFNKALCDFNRAIELSADEDEWYQFNRALAYQALNQLQEARVDIALAIELAQSIYDKDNQNLCNTFNLALYYLAAENIERSKFYYRDALVKGASLEYIKMAIRDLENYLTIFSNNQNAKTIQQALQKKLQERSLPQK